VAKVVVLKRVKVHDVQMQRREVSLARYARVVADAAARCGITRAILCDDRNGTITVPLKNWEEGDALWEDVKDGAFVAVMTCNGCGHVMTLRYRTSTHLREAYTGRDGFWFSVDKHRG